MSFQNNLENFEGILPNIFVLRMVRGQFPIYCKESLFLRCLTTFLMLSSLKK